MKFFNKKNNNKGFSLVELIIAVVIMGIVVIPLLQAFTTSASLTAKSRRYGEQTAAAQNIQEIIEALGVKSMISCVDSGGITTSNLQNTNALKMIYGSNDDLNKQKTTITKETDSSGNNVDCLYLKDFVSGGKTFDAKVVFAAETGNLSKINNKVIAQYTDMTGTFSQPYAANQNPDDLSSNEFVLKYGNKAKVFSRTRTIDVKANSVESSSEDDGYDVSVDVTFTYKYRYYKYNELTNQYEKNPNGGFYTEELAYTYNIFPNPHHIDSYDEEVACYLMYYAFYESSSVEAINIYVDNNNPDSELNFKLFLVKQWPMVDDGSGNRVVADETSFNATVAQNSQDILYDDSMYMFSINEYRNAKFEIKTFGDNNHADESMMNVFTNANVHFEDNEIWDDYTYRIRSLSKNQWFYFYEDSILKNQLVKTEKEERFYNITIYICDVGTLPGEMEDSCLYKFEATKLQ